MFQRFLKGRESRKAEVDAAFEEIERDLSLAKSTNTFLARKISRRDKTLADIINAIDSVKTPNGTLRKVRRIALEGMRS